MTPCKPKTCAAGRQHSFPRADHFGVGLPPSKGQQHGWCVPRPAAPASVPVERSNPRGNTSQSKFKSLDKNSRISVISLFRLQALFLIPSSHAHISVQSKIQLTDLTTITVFLSTHLCIGSSLALQETSVPGSWEHRPALWWRLGTMEITSPCPASKQRQQKMCAGVQWTRQKWLGMRWNDYDHMYGCEHWPTKFAKLFRIVEAYYVVPTCPD